LLATAAMLGAVRVEAEPPPRAFDIDWTAPETCPASADVRAGIERYLGRPVASSADAVAARAVVTREKGNQWRMKLTTTVRRETRERVIEGDSCRAVADAAALILAFVIDPKSAATRSPATSATGTAPAATEMSAPESPAPAPGAPSDRSNLATVPPETSAETNTPLAGPPPAEPAPTARPDAADSPPRPTSPSAPPRPWTLRALAGADSSALPAWSGFVGAAVGRAFGRASIELSGAYFAPRTREIGGGAQARGGTFELLTLGGRTCYAFFGPTVELAPCVGAEYGTVRGMAFGVGVPGVGKGLWLAATASGAARWRAAPWLGAVAEVGVALPLVRPEYVIDNVGVVYRADFVGLRLLAALESYF
jgi:hypothetical protein